MTCIFYMGVNRGRGGMGRRTSQNNARAGNRAFAESKWSRRVGEGGGGGGGGGERAVQHKERL